jgi:nucleotide-binding universal stress UspA family protein
MKVLIGVDGSDGSFAAVRFAGQLLLPGRDQVGLYYALPKSVARLAKKGTRQETLTNAILDEARARLPEVLRTAAHTIVDTRKPQRGLVAAAAEWGADLLVVGARGLSPIRGLLLGSVSRSVADAAKVPVLVIRSTTSDAARSGLKLLLADDGSATTRAMGRLLHEFNWPTGSKGRVMTVMESLFVGEVPEWLASRVRDAESEAMAQAWQRKHEAERREKHAALLALQEQLPESFRGSEPLVVEGNPADQILRAAAAEHSDLIVVGRAGTGRLSRLLLGSTSLPVLAHAPCSVLVVPKRSDTK